IAAVVGGAPQTISTIAGLWVWELIQGTEPPSPPGRLRNLEFVSFVISLHVIVATLLSLVATVLAQSFMRVQDQRS
ncbi:MAG TPA: hypothetical protein VHK01_03720, partial [Lacipirellulaceae bacterium]|nr:hypothetical protein [Lacipirellulaceae bacterium]